MKWPYIMVFASFRIRSAGGAYKFSNQSSDMLGYIAERCQS